MEFSNGIFYSAADYYKSLFGKKAYKVSLDAGCTCPNRDGTKGTGGCAFCSASGSGDFAQDRTLSVKEQLEKAKRLVSAKLREPLYIAYFQNFTSTYGNAKRLLALFAQAADASEVCGVAIATRPDCLSDEMLAGLSELSRRTYVSVELGFQTSNPQTAHAINRCYENAELDTAIKRIKRAAPSVHIVCHVIFGLPGETADDMLSSVRYVVGSGADGIKIAVLHILRGTALYEDWAAGRVPCMEMDDYFYVLGEALKIIPQKMVVHRLTGDGAKRILCAPLWTACKKRVLNAMLKYFRANGIRQGLCFEQKSH